MESVNYASVSVPVNYKCSVCNQHGQKLWRQYNVFHDIQLYCCDCAAKDQEKDLINIDDYGFSGIEFDRTDQIGWLIPAIPRTFGQPNLLGSVEEGDTYWGHFSTPQEGIEWWKNLPTRKIGLDMKNDKTMDPTIYFYSSKTEYGYMSNFARYSVVMNKTKFKTSEHYYQSRKYVGTHWESKVRKAKTPMEAAVFGRHKDGPLRRDWESVKDNVMREVVLAKFVQHPELAKQLLATGDSKIVEHTSSDSYWADGGNGKGKNMLGIILMEVRAKLKSLLKSL